MTTGLLYDPIFLQHEPGRGHPERPARLEAADRHLQTEAWYHQLRKLSPQSVDQESLELVHDARYIERAEAACRNGSPFLDTPDVGICEHSCEIARLAVGGAIALTDAVMTGELQNGFALVRPPGHHAESDIALGFCLFNTIAIAARHVQRAHGVEKILILDWDVHHGNGTQHCFESDPSVLYVSLHQYPYYPGTGAYSETGVGRGMGATLNCPMPAGSVDADYEAAFLQKILPRIEQFAPELVLLSAGFDAHRNDPLAQVNLSTEMFTWMTERMMEVANRHANGRLVSFLEGGYDLATLSQCVSLHVHSLMTYDSSASNKSG